jgi:hypothetical protein
MVIEAYNLRSDRRDDRCDSARLMRPRRCPFLHRWMPIDATKKGAIARRCTRCFTVQEWMPPWSEQVGGL